jgi:hypothetical protein
MISIQRKVLVSLIITIVISLTAISTLANENNSLIMDYYYGSTCGECSEINASLIQPYFAEDPYYNNLLIFQYKDIDTNDTAYEEWRNLTPIVGIPAVVIRNDTYATQAIDLALYQFDIEKGYQNLSFVINEFLSGNYSNKTDENVTIISTPWGEFDITNWSLPILTIILGGLDSFNPCAFFILIFLLNLLIYARSRKRMLLIGGIFIFFSGLLYMVFMFIMYETLRVIKTPENIFIITLIVGCIVLPMGILNIKDFFFFKKGASLSIPEDKKPKIYKQMRGLVKNPKVSATILGTIILAGTVNFYELLCTFSLPFVFINQLVNFNISQGSATYYGYILLYNIVYVIPLTIIVLIFVLTLGKRKLTEWHGQIMKLVSGIMLASFGTIFLINYKALENPITPILLLLFSLVVTGVIAFIWKQFKQTPDRSNQD